jgi:hypothetical protein
MPIIRSPILAIVVLGELARDRLLLSYGQPSGGISSRPFANRLCIVFFGVLGDMNQ